MQNCRYMPIIDWIRYNNVKGGPKKDYETYYRGEDEPFCCKNYFDKLRPSFSSAGLS